MSVSPHNRPPNDKPPAASSVQEDRWQEQPERRPLIEVGWIIAGTLPEADFQATRQARDESIRWLQEYFPEFEWKLPIVERREFGNSLQVESTQLLDTGVTQCNLRHWDFALVITPADLVSHYKPNAYSVVSRSLQTGLISTARTDPQAYDHSVSHEERIQLMAGRTHALAIRLIAHLAGVERREDSDGFMSSVEAVEDLDRPPSFDAVELRQLRQGLREIADLRLEEQTDVRRVWALRFYAQATWINRRQIAQAIFQAKPWQFPYRFNRLTAASASAVLILMVTAEAWELGAGQSAPVLTGLAVLAVLLTTLYVVARQKLFVRRERLPLSELSVVTNVSTFTIVLIGMATTFFLLATSIFVFGQLFFGPTLVANWSSAGGQESLLLIYVRLSTFAASVGMFIGALGASFESNHYFRHITFVDEEI